MSSSEKREHRRYPKKLTVDVHVLVMPATQSQEGYEARGQTIDIGRGGVLLRLDKSVVEGVKVRIRFWELPPDVKIWPLMKSGRIVRVEPGEAEADEAEAAGHMISAGSRLASEFMEPLEELTVPD